MLSIAAVSGGQANYYTHLSQSDYYAREQEADGVWMGAGAERLQLGETVEPEAFHNLFHGFSPDGERKLVQNAGKTEGYHAHKPALDLTYSVPKSVSIVWSVADDITRAAIEAAAFAAIRENIAHMEDTCAYTRVGKGGSDWQRAGLAVAVFRHGAARPAQGAAFPDPQLHFHAVCLHFGVREDLRTGSMVSKPFFHAKIEHGRLFRQCLAREMEGIGFAVRWRESVEGDRFFEIDGVPESLMDASSKRHADIIRDMGERGAQGAAEAARSALLTRQPKRAVAPETLRERWEALAAEHGFTKDTIAALCRREETSCSQTPEPDVDRPRTVPTPAAPSLSPVSRGVEATRPWEPMVTAKDPSREPKPSLSPAPPEPWDVAQEASLDDKAVTRRDRQTPALENSQTETARAAPNSQSAERNAPPLQTPSRREDAERTPGEESLPKRRPDRGYAQPRTRHEARLVQAALKEAIGDALRFQSHFSERKLRDALAERLKAKGGHELERLIPGAIDSYLNSDKVAPLGQWRNAERFSTPEMRQTERRMIADAQTLNVRSAGRSGWANAAVGALWRGVMGDSLNASEREALQGVTRERGALKILTAETGTDVGATLRAAHAAWKMQGYTVLGTALSGAAAETFQKNTGISSWNLTRLLSEMEGRRPTPALFRGHQFSSVSAMAKYAQKAAKPRTVIDKNTILIVDQAEGLDTPRMAQLLERVRRGGGKIILVGDAEGRQPVGPGAALHALRERFGETVLVKPTARPEPEWARTALDALRSGDGSVFLSSFAQQGRLHIAPDRAEAMKILIQDWRAATRGGSSKTLAATLLIAGKTEEVHELNRRAQTERRLAGELGRASVPLPKRDGQTKPDCLYAGDRVVLTRGAARYGVASGERGTVTFLEPLTRNVRVRLDTGRSVTLPLYRFRDLQLGYAVTAQRAAALTAEKAFVLIGGGAQDRHTTIVEATRSLADTRLYADKASMNGPNQVDRNRVKPLAMDVEKQAAPTPRKTPRPGPAVSPPARQRAPLQNSQTPTPATRRPERQRGRTLTDDLSLER